MMTHPILETTCLHPIFAFRLAAYMALLICALLQLLQEHETFFMYRMMLLRKLAIIYLHTTPAFSFVAHMPAIINRPGVARAVLQTYIFFVIKSLSAAFRCNLQSIINPKPLELES